MGVSGRTYRRAFATKGFCFLCEQEDLPLTHHSSIQKRNVCETCAEALAWAETTLRLVGFRCPSDLDAREAGDSEKERG